MAADFISNSRTGLVKLACIPLLVIILLATLFWPQPDAVDPAEKPAAANPGASIAANLPPAGGLAGKRSGHWRSDVQAALAVDPFSCPAGLAALLGSAAGHSVAGEGESNSGTTAVATIAHASASQPQVQAIFRRGDKTSALVDGQIVRIGDRLPSGQQVLGISEQGVILSGVPTVSAQEGS
jgi:hypothetical protein